MGERFVGYEAVIFVIYKSENSNSSALTLTSFAKNKWKKNELDMQQCPLSKVHSLGTAACTVKILVNFLCRSL